MILNRNIVVDGQTYFSGERVPHWWDNADISTDGRGVMPQVPMTFKDQQSRAIPIVTEVIPEISGDIKS